MYLDLQGYQQFVQRLPLDVAISGEFQESHYWGNVAAISKSRTLKREMDFAATCIWICRVASSLSNGYHYDVAISGEFQESHYWGNVAAISKSRTLKREMDFAATCIWICRVASSLSNGYH